VAFGLFGIQLTVPLYSDKVQLMVDINDKIWDLPPTRQLTTVLASITDEATLKAVLRDVMTESEIIEISSRLEAARMLSSGANYTQITKSTKLSSRTIARISDWMKNGTGGYRTALTLIGHHQTPHPLRSKEA
jgi:TrpR-related protein YerC/YecD